MSLPLIESGEEMMIMSVIGPHNVHEAFGFEKRAAPSAPTISHLQETQPWTIPYGVEQTESRVPHKEVAHALAHIAKATGHLFNLVEQADHGRDLWQTPEGQRTLKARLADLVICAIRIANVVPGGPINLEQAVLDRIVGVNGIAEASPTPTGDA
jgi:hypothetical protein